MGNGGTDWGGVAMAAAVIYGIYVLKDSKFFKGADELGASVAGAGTAAADAGKTYLNILNPQTEFQWGKDAASWFWGLWGDKYQENWGHDKQGNPVINPQGSGWDNAITYKGNLELNRQGRQVYAGDFTAAEVADWKNKGWIQSGSYMLAPSLVAEQDAFVKQMVSEKSAAVLASMNNNNLGVSRYTGNPITSRIVVGSTKSRYTAKKESNATSAQNRAVSDAWKKIVAAKNKK